MGHNHPLLHPKTLQCEVLHHGGGSPGERVHEHVCIELKALREVNGLSGQHHIDLDPSSARVNWRSGSLDDRTQCLGAIDESFGGQIHRVSDVIGVQSPNEPRHG